VGKGFPLALCFGQEVILFHFVIIENLNIISFLFAVYLRNEELHNVYSSPSTIRKIKSRRTGLAGHVARKGEVNSCKILAGKPEGKTPLGRPRCR
jgi:hypothetical protein